jgi:hypothetical protein
MLAGLLPRAPLVVISARGIDSGQLQELGSNAAANSFRDSWWKEDFPTPIQLSGRNRPRIRNTRQVFARR